MSNDKEANEVQVTQKWEISAGDTDEKKIWEQKALSKRGREKERKKKERKEKKKKKEEINRGMSLDSSSSSDVQTETNALPGSFTLNQAGAWFIHVGPGRGLVHSRWTRFLVR